MSSIDEKMSQCEILLNDLNEMIAIQDPQKFLARFTSYANQVSAIRQYLQNSELKNLGSAASHPEQYWMETLENNVDFAAVLALRHVDQHATSIRVDRQAIHLTVTDTVTMSDSFSFIVMDENGNIVSKSTPLVPAREEAKPPLESLPADMTVRYYCDASTIPDFMVSHRDIKQFGRIPGQKIALNKGGKLPMEAAVVAYVASTDLLSIAKRCHATLISAIIQARSQGFFR